MAGGGGVLLGKKIGHLSLYSIKNEGTVRISYLLRQALQDFLNLFKELTMECCQAFYVQAPFWAQSLFPFCIRVSSQNRQAVTTSLIL